MEGRKDLPQLVMMLEDLKGLPEPVLPPGYDFRTAKETDGVHWVDVVNDSFGYQAARSFDDLKKDICFSLSRVHFVCRQGLPVGTASAWHRETWGEDTGYLHMVGVRKEHTGKGLGKNVSLVALKDMEARGCRRCVLQTDDFRIPAIKTYGRLGFRPLITHESHLERWKTIHDAIGESYFDLP